MKFNPNIFKVPQSASVELNDRIQEMKSTGKKIYPFNVGDPDFDTHPKIIEFAYGAMKSGATHYCPSRGLEILRESIAEKYYRDYNVKVNPHGEIIITSGTVHAYYILLQSILSRGNEVLLPDPSWMTHANMVEILGGTPVRVPAKPVNNFLPTIDSWIKSISEKTKAIVINFPSNPTGSIADSDYLQKLKNIAEEKELVLISDEVYEKIIFDKNKYSTILNKEPRNDSVCVINSFSKTFAMTGWRVGFLIAPANVVEHALKASQYSITCLAPFIQIAAAKALNDPIVNEWVQFMVAEYQKRKDLVKEIIQSNSELLEGFEPKGAFYYFINIKNNKFSSIEYSKLILDKTGAALVPGSVYGNEGEGYLRLSLTSNLNILEEGLEIIIKFLKET